MAAAGIERVDHMAAREPAGKSGECAVLAVEVGQDSPAELTWGVLAPVWMPPVPELAA